MATIKTRQPKKTKLSIGYRQSALNGWQYSNKSALDIINEYQKKIQNGDWLSSEDRTTYKNAIDTYTSTGNKLREASKHYGQKYTADEEKSWTDSLSSLQSGYNSVNDFYNQFANDIEYGKWYDYNTKLTNYNNLTGASDYAENSKYIKGVADNRYNFINQSKGWGFANPFSYAANGNDTGKAQLTDFLAFPDAVGSWLKGDAEMTDEQIGIYNYLYASEGKEKADEYLDFIADTVMQQKADASYKNFKLADTLFDITTHTNNLGEYIYGFGSGVDTGLSGFYNAGALVEGKEGFTPASQYVSSQIHKELGGKNGELTLEQVFYDLANTTGNMAPSIGIGALTTPLGGAVAMGLSSAGNNYASMIDQGYDVNTARAYGIMTGVAEAGMSYAFSGIGKLGGKLTGKAISKFTSGINNAILRIAGNVVGNVASEALEEATQTILDPVFKWAATLGAEEMEAIDWGEVGYSALLGGLSAGLLEGGPSIVNTGLQSHQAYTNAGGATLGGTIKAAIDPNINFSDYVSQGAKNVTNTAGAYANAVAEVDPNNKAAKYVQDQIKSGKNVSGYQINRLATELDTATTNHDRGAIKSAVEARLNELGETGDVSAIAEAIARQTMGEKLSLNDKSILKKSTYGEWVSSELDPESVNRGFDGEYSDFAESIGTKRVNAEAYNRQTKAETANATPENASAVEANFGASAEIKTSLPKSEIAENASLIEQAAKDKIGKIDGFTEETANVMVKDYDGSVSPSEYVTTFEEAFKLGRDNAQIKELTRLSKDSGVIGRALLHAYDAGLQSRNVALEATNPENTVLQNGTESAIINTESESITNEGKTGTEGIPLRRGGERINGAYSEGQIPSVEGSAGQTASRGEARRIADSKGVSLYNTGREVRVADLGILNGSKQQKVRVIDNEADYTPSMKQAAADAKKHGLTAKFYVGDNILIEEANGSISGVRGYILGNTILVRADHEVYTSDQIARHEAGHDMIAKGQVNVKAVKKKLIEVVGKENVELATESYAAAYDGSGLTTDEIWEELICDSLGDINIFGRAKGLREHFESFKTEVQSAVKATKTEAKTTEGVTEGKASRQISPQSNKTNLSKGESVNEQGTQDSRLLVHGQEIAAVGGSENGQRKQGYDTATPSAQVANDGINGERYAGKSGHNGKVTSWLAGNRFVSQASVDRFRDTLLRDRSGLKSTDVNGKNVPTDILQKFKNSIFTDEEGRLLTLYHWTPNSFKVFARGDIGFHFGIYEASIDRRESKTKEKRGADIVKEVYLNITNPILLDDFGGEWDASLIAYQLWERGFITLEQQAKINRMGGASYGDYNSPASIYVRELLGKKGYDGVIYENTVEGKKSLSAIALYPDQIYTVSEETVGKGKASRELDSLGNELSPAVQKRFANSKVVDENGRLKVVYHGTPAGEFFTFDKSKGSVEGDFGSGFYFTDNEADVSANYEGGGPDFENKVWRRAEQLFDEDPDIQMDEAREQARAEMFKGSHKFEVYLNVENPALVGETILFAPESYAENYNEEDYDSYDDYIGDVEQLLVDDVDSIIWDIERNVDLYSNTDQIRNVLYDAYYEGGIDVQKLKDKINELYLESNDGEMVANEVARQIIESLGYDGIIDSTVSSKFKNMGMEEGTTHYIVFKPNQIKSITNQNPTDNPDIRYSRELDLIDYINENEVDDDLAKEYSKADKSMIDRLHLINALESITDYPSERGILSDYRAMVETIAELEKRIASIDADIKVLSKNAKVNAEAIKTLKAERKMLEMRVHKADEKVLKLESTKALRGVVESEREKAYRKAKQEGREALLTQRAKSDAKLDAVKDYYRGKLAERRAAANAKLDATVKRYQEARAKGIEGRHKTAERRAILGIATELDKLLNKGTKEKNVKKGAAGLVRSALDLSDMLFATDDEILLNGIGTDYTSAEAAAMDAYKELYEEYHSYDNAVTENKARRAELRSQMNDLKSEFSGVLERERNRINEAQASDTYDALINAYKELQNSKDSFIKQTFDNDTLAHLEKMKEDVGKTTVKEMTLSQLKEVHKAFTMIKTMVQRSNKLFIEEGKATVKEKGEEAIREISAKGHKKSFGEVEKWFSTLSLNNLKPIYLMERTSSKVLQREFQKVLDGESVWATDMAEAKAFLDGEKAKHGYEKWNLDKTVTFKNNTGQEFALTLGDMMTIYAYTKRGEQALEHLRTDGFVFDESRKVKGKFGIEREINDKTAYKISDDLLFKILGTLTKDQKAYVDATQKYLSDVMGSKGNEVSTKLLGIDLFTEENYLPIRSEGAYLERVREQNAGEAKIKNKGFTKPTQKNARNAIVLENYNKLWTEHVAEMSSYHAFTLPLEDFYRVYNYQNSSDAEVNKAGVIPALDNAYGKAMTDAIDQLLKDLNGGARSDPRESGFKKLLSLHKKAKVMASLSVVVQQPSALFRAQAIIDPKFFIGKKIGKEKHKALWNEVKTYAPVAVIKDMGHFDVGMGKASADWLLDEKSLMDKITDIASKPASYADEVTWVAIWNAVKLETANKNPKLNTSSKEFLTLAGKRFEDVIRHTQVYDSTLARSGNMRSKSGLMQMVTSFMAEPTTSINMREMALRSGDKARIVRTTAAVYASTLINAILVALPYAMRDDDEDETFVEKYISALTTSFVDNINPLTALPFFKDVWSLARGYDVERTDMSLVDDLLSSIEKLGKSVISEEKDAGEITDNAVKVFGDLASLLGLPVDNVYRDVMSFVNFGKTITGDIKGMDTTWKSIEDALQESFRTALPGLGLTKAENKSKKLYDAIMAGDEKYVARFKNEYVEKYSDIVDAKEREKKITSAYESDLRKALRDNDPRVKEAALAKLNGDDATYERLCNEVLAEGKFDRTIIIDAFAAEYNYHNTKKKEAEAEGKTYP